MLIRVKPDHALALMSSADGTVDLIRSKIK